MRSRSIKKKHANKIHKAFGRGKVNETQQTNRIRIAFQGELKIGINKLLDVVAEEKNGEQITRYYKTNVAQLEFDRSYSDIDCQ